MRLATGKTASAILLLATLCEASKHGLTHLDVLERRHQHHRRLHASAREEDGALASEPVLRKRESCSFPTNAGLVSVTPDQQNAGWALSPDQPCTPGNYCPYACPPGQLAMQWNPKATSYTYPLSMDGGLFCDENGDIQKPFPNQDYCVDGEGTISVQNNAGKTVSFCQTVLPGNEAMLIPTAVDASQVLAVPGMDYWCSTAAHYYINDPGLTTDEACIWGDGSKALGNWSPYVAGANVDENGNTFVKLGFNPIWTGSNFGNTMPNWGVKIECNGNGCNGLPCSIDPSVNSVNEVTSSESASGAGGANFCVATIPKGMTANIVVFSAGESTGSGSSSPASSSTSTKPAPSTSSTSAPPPSSTSKAPVSTSITPKTSATPTSIIPSSTPTSTIQSTTSVKTTSIASSAVSTSISTPTPTFVSAPKNATDPTMSISPTGSDVPHNLDPFVQTSTGSLSNPAATAGAQLAATASDTASKKPSSGSVTFRASGTFGAIGLTLVAALASWLL